MILSSPEPGVIDTYDTSISSLMKYAMLYWPGGNPGYGAKVETIVQGDLRSEEIAPEAARVRRLILGASVGAAALTRVPSYFREVWRTVDANVPGMALDIFKRNCEELQRPFGVCAISDVTNGDPGRSIMHFWFPAMVNPEACLHEMQQAVSTNAS